MQYDDKHWAMIGGDASRKLYVQRSQYEKWETIQRKHAGNYYMTSVIRAVHSLTSTAGGRRLRPEKKIFDGAAIHYHLDDHGNVRIYWLEISEDYRPQGSQQATGLYRVRNSSEDPTEPVWDTRNDEITKMDTDHRWNNAHYAAVSGKFDFKEDAGSILIEHISRAYRTAVKEQDINRPRNHYSLYWQNGGHKSDRQRDHLVSLIQQAVATGARVNWLVHGEGAATFVRAMKVLETRLSPAPVSPEREKELRAQLRLQSVFFSNPRGAGTSVKELKAGCEKAGLDYLDTSLNTGDVLFNPDARRRALNTVATIGGGILLSDGVGGALGSEDLVNTITKVLASPDAWGIAAAVTGGYLVLRDKVKTNSGYARNLPGVISSTFGKGNQRWAG